MCKILINFITECMRLSLTNCVGGINAVMPYSFAGFRSGVDLTVVNSAKRCCCLR